MWSIVVAPSGILLWPSPVRASSIWLTAKRFNHWTYSLRSSDVDRPGTARHCPHRDNRGTLPPDKNISNKSEMLKMLWTHMSYYWAVGTSWLEGEKESKVTHSRFVNDWKKNGLSALLSFGALSSISHQWTTTIIPFGATHAEWFSRNTEVDVVFLSFVQVFQKDLPETIQDTWDHLTEEPERVPESNWRFASPKALLDNLCHTMQCLFGECFAGAEAPQHREYDRGRRDCSVMTRTRTWSNFICPKWSDFSIFYLLHTSQWKISGFLLCSI